MTDAKQPLPLSVRRLICFFSGHDEDWIGYCLRCGHHSLTPAGEEYRRLLKKFWANERKNLGIVYPPDHINESGQRILDSGAWRERLVGQPEFPPKEPE